MTLILLYILLCGTWGISEILASSISLYSFSFSLTSCFTSCFLYLVSEITIFRTLLSVIYYPSLRSGTYFGLLFLFVLGGRNKRGLNLWLSLFLEFIDSIYTCFGTNAFLYSISFVLLGLILESNLFWSKILFTFWRVYAFLPVVHCQIQL